MKLEIEHITKTYKNNEALKDICISLEPGVYGILGANGAGKSTLMNLITDNLARTSGNILYDGVDIRKLGKKFRELVGYMPQQQGFYESLSASAFLFYMASVKGLSKKEAKKQVPEILKAVNLSEVADKSVGSFSGGMKQRVLLAQALLGDPKIIILDEPTAGLDPKERIRIRNFIAELSTDKIILYATHVVSDIECIADKVIVIRNGELLQSGTPTELMETVEGHIFEIACKKEHLKELCKKYPNGNVLQKKHGFLFRIAGDNIPEGFYTVTDGIGLEDVYLYYFAIPL